MNKSTRPSSSKWLSLKEIWRRGWDSNPRWPFDHSGFRDRCTKPLCDLSAEEKDEGGRMKDEDGSEGFPPSSFIFYPCRPSGPEELLHERAAVVGEHARRQGHP